MKNNVLKNFEKYIYDIYTAINYAYKINNNES